MSWNAFKTPRRRLQHKIRKKIVFSKEVSRKIHFSNKLFRSNLQEMFWKLAGATNSHLRRNLFVSKVATYSIAAIFQRLLVFSNTSFRLFPKIQDREKCRKIRTRITPNRDTFHAVLTVLLPVEKSGSSSLIFKVTTLWLSPTKFGISNLLFPYIDHFKKMIFFHILLDRICE